MYQHNCCQRYELHNSEGITTIGYKRFYHACTRFYRRPRSKKAGFPISNVNTEGYGPYSQKTVVRALPVWKKLFLMVQ